MQINGSFEECSNYVKSNYDINDKLIEIKYEHSKRVANLMILIASKMNLSKREMLLAYFIGLFHDLGRFEQAVREHKFDNSNFDHAAYSNKILFQDDFISKFDIPHELYDVINALQIFLFSSKVKSILILFISILYSFNSYCSLAKFSSIHREIHQL